MAYENDKELTTYRNLIEMPDSYEDGFDIKTIIGALFMGLMVTPGSLYIMLVAGENVGPAARWVTIFLFAEMARRSLKELRQQEVFVLYYMTGIVMLPNSGILWNIYMVGSDAFQAMGITPHVPHWVVPSQEVLAMTGRTLFHPAWLPAMGVFAVTMIVQRVDHFGLGYFLYRIASDGERLPFPMAPIGASGILAMAETKEKTQRWRPLCFSLGGVMGLLFGLIYLIVPAVTGILLREPVFLIPIPWIELTPSIQNIIPATAFNIAPNLAMVILGMTLPFWAVVGGFLGVIITFILNPILYDGGILRHVFGLPVEGGLLTSWRPGMQTVDTLFMNNIDFYMSFGLGITFFVAVLGIGQGFYPLIRRLFTSTPDASDDGLTTWQRAEKGKAGRGDISLYLSLGIYVFCTTAYIVLSTYLVEGFPWWIFIIYGFVYAPLTGYAAVKVEAIAGQVIMIPMVKEAAFILSGYKGVAIWYAPIPIHNYAMRSKGFRVAELTGTRLSSIIKTDIIAVPIVLFSLIAFSSFIWSQAPLDSSQYPYVQKVWDLQSRNLALMYSSTLPGQRSLFFEALKPDVLGYGFVGAGVLYAILSLFGLPVLLIFGAVRGLGQTNPMGLIPEFVGAMVGRFYFKRKYGDMWSKFTPAIFAGFTCGVGLCGMMAVAFRLIATSIAPLPY